MRGIYTITNKITGRQYIGCSGDIKKRWKGHRKDLRRGKHHSRYLQNSWNKHGGGLFSFSVVALALPGADLVELERVVIADRQPKYNSMRPCYDNGGWEHREETKQVQSHRAKSLWEDPGYVEKYRAGLASFNEAQRRKWEPYRLAKKALRRLAYLKWWVENCCLYYDGRLQTKAQWADELGITRRALGKRLAKANGNLGCVLGPYHVPGKLCLYPKPLPRRQENMITHDGKTQTLGAWSRETGLGKGTITNRLNLGWSVEKALTTPVGETMRGALHTYFGEQLSAAEIAQRHDATPEAVRAWVRRGLPVEAFSKQLAGRKARLYEVDGVVDSIVGWAKRLRRSENHLRALLYRRKKSGYSAESTIKDCLEFDAVYRTEE